MLPNEILKGRLVRGIQRFFAIQGDPPTPQLSFEVQPGFDVMNPAPEFFYIAGERLATCFFDVQGDATHPAYIQLYNPTGSGVMLIVDEWWFSSNVAATAGVQWRDANAATLLTAATVVARNRDARWFPSIPVGQIRTDTASAAAGSILATGLIDNPQPLTVVKFPYIIAPGQWLSILSSANAGRLAGTVLWRERPLEELEQRFGV